MTQFSVVVFLEMYGHALACHRAKGLLPGGKRVKRSKGT
eukprot:COSAG02_NODE_33782_length_494_cov_1.430380_2_plen_38_part_01